MRWSGLLGLVAACGGGGDGAMLTVRAIDGPAAAARLEIVLANADGDSIASADQRTAPGSLAEVPVRYYRQRATGGELGPIEQLDGFVVRIEPNPEVADDSAFVPFAIAYDAGDRIIAIGAVVDPAGEPLAVALPRGRADKYDVALAALSERDDLDVAAGAVATVRCGALRSGLAWQPQRGPQLRLLLPDTAMSAGATDASDRPTDLDCDGHEASSDDCDDLRPAFHADHPEQCDGVDSNCDRSQLALLPCPVTDGSCGPDPPPGTAVCRDVAGEQPGLCTPDPRCQCELGPCTRCVVAFTPTSDQALQSPCAPAIGRLKLVDCIAATPCVVQVLAATPPWEALVSGDPSLGFGRRATVSDGEVVIKLKQSGGDLRAQPSDGVGAVQLGVTSLDDARTIGVAIELAPAAVGDCPDAGNGDSTMQCSP